MGAVSAELKLPNVTLFLASRPLCRFAPLALDPLDSVHGTIAFGTILEWF
jgi:hypothetical protein